MYIFLNWQYKFAPDLIMLDAYETVESWMMARAMLNPRKLIPAMMRYTNEPHAKYESIIFLLFVFAPIWFCTFCSEHLIGLISSYMFT